MRKNTRDSSVKTTIAVFSTFLLIEKSRQDKKKRKNEKTKRHVFQRITKPQVHTTFIQQVTCMENEKKYCIRLRFIEPHPRVIVYVHIAHKRRTSTRSTKASVSQVHSTITRRHTPLIFAHVFLPSQRLQ